MPRKGYNADDFYDMIKVLPLAYGREDMSGGNVVIDRVADHQEWVACKAAILRWVAEQDAEYDQLARDQEAGIE